MKIWAHIDNSNTVINIVVNNIKPEGNYIETFSDGSHGHYAGIGFTWNGQYFVPPKPGKNWTWIDGNWTPPKPYTTDVTDENGNFIRTKLWSDEQEDWV